MCECFVRVWLASEVRLVHSFQGQGPILYYMIQMCAMCDLAQHDSLIVSPQGQVL